MMLKFSKMHGLGNDFVVIDALRQQIELTAEQVRRLAHRRFGVGCDQVLLIEAPRTAATDFYYRIYNADGGEVEQCGNGARCLARFVRDNGLTGKNALQVETRAGIIGVQLLADGNVCVDMGVPDFEPAAIPFQATAAATEYELDVDGEALVIGAVSLGNPHAVMRVDSVDTARVASLGPAISTHARFPRGVNAGFMEICGRDAIRLRVHERGSGETLACGSGACAAVAVGRQQGRLDDMVRVQLPGGELTISWAGEGEPVYMTGPATHVFEGHIEL
jgi:diaminopimelate epimerase